jgi:hypothetical protein
LRGGDLAALEAIFSTCEVDARGGYSKQTALAFHFCPDELARWLVEQGADIDARDTYGRTPLHNRAASRNGRIEVLLALGADIHVKDPHGDTPLHKAAMFANAAAVRLLVERGADRNSVNDMQLTPLAAGLQRCANIDIAAMADVAELLFTQPPARKTGIAGLIDRAFTATSNKQPDTTPQLKAFVQTIGANFEFARAGFNPDSLEATSTGLERLYALFGVAPVPRRQMHDGVAPIIPRSTRWQDQHAELWELLVPSKGAAMTVQGEVIRISGRIGDEVDRNGAVNWDADYNKMARAFLGHIGTGNSLPASDRERAAQLLAKVRTQEGATGEICELAVQWIKLNPNPVRLRPPDYGR